MSREGDILTHTAGLKCFGLASPIVCHLIQQMEGADQCGNYVMKPFERGPRRREQTEAAPVIPVPTIAYDENGSPALPIHLSGMTSVIDLGHIVTDRLGFHCERYIFPAGFRSSRLHFSTLNPSEKVWYTSEILDAGGDIPVFRVTMDSHREISFEGNSPSTPWNIIATSVLKMRGGGSGAATLHGAECFGLTSPIICYLIQQMEGAEQCANYVMKQFEKEAPRPEETEDPPVLPIPYIPCDFTGSLIRPIHLSSLIYVSDLGRIVIDRLGFHTDRYIYPAGFRSSRLYCSTLDPSDRVWYTSEILDTGGEMPLFRVTMNSRPEISFQGNSPNVPWSLIGKRVSEMRSDGHRRIKLFGQDFFGLTSPTICYLIQQMAGADKCVNYVMKRFAPPTSPHPMPEA
jgi:hypothetical protein